MNINFCAHANTLGGFNSPLGDGRICLYAEAELPGARGVTLVMQASPLGYEEMPSEAAYSVFRDARRLIDNADDLLVSVMELVEALEEENPGPWRERIDKAKRTVRRVKGGE